MHRFFLFIALWVLLLGFQKTAIGAAAAIPVVVQVVVPLAASVVAHLVDKKNPIQIGVSVPINTGPGPTLQAPPVIIVGTPGGGTIEVPLSSPTDSSSPATSQPPSSTSSYPEQTASTESKDSSSENPLDSEKGGRFSSGPSSSSSSSSGGQNHPSPGGSSSFPSDFTIHVESECRGGTCQTQLVGTSPQMSEKALHQALQSGGFRCESVPGNPILAPSFGPEGLPLPQPRFSSEIRCHQNLDLRPPPGELPFLPRNATLVPLKKEGPQWKPPVYPPHGVSPDLQVPPPARRSAVPSSSRPAPSCELPPPAPSTQTPEPIPDSPEAVFEQPPHTQTEELHEEANHQKAVQHADSLKRLFKEPASEISEHIRQWNPESPVPTADRKEVYQSLKSYRKISKTLLKRGQRKFVYGTYSGSSTRLRTEARYDAQELAQGAAEMGLKALSKAVKQMTGVDSVEAYEEVRQNVSEFLEENEAYLNLASQFLDVAISLSPLSGGRDLYELMTGKDLITGEELSASDRASAGAGVFSLGLGNKAKIPVKMGQLLRDLKDTLKASKRGKELIRSGAGKAIREGEKRVEAAGKGKASSNPNKTGDSAGEKPKGNYENPGHHDPSNKGPNPYNPKKSTLPKNHEELWENSVSDNKGVRWTKVGDGKKSEYHRFNNDGNGNWHWTGSTNGATNTGSSNSIPKHLVPKEVR